MSPVHTISINLSNSKKRIDTVIADSLEISRSKAQCMVSAGLVKLFEIPISSNSHLTNLNDVYTVKILDFSSQENLIAPNPNISLKIIHEDADIIVIDKPPNIAVHQGCGTGNTTICNALLAHCGSILNTVGSPIRPGIVHRLDKDTSGVMVAAKTQRAYFELSDQITSKKFQKEYLALVWDIPNPSRGLIETNIRVKKTDRTMMEVSKYSGKLAVTEYEVQRTFGNTASLVKFILHTGRTHQIRVHASFMGHSIIGDQKYGKNSRKSVKHGLPFLKDFHRQSLHSCLLAFHHPKTGKLATFTSNLSDDILEVVSYLEEHTSPVNRSEHL